LAVWRLMTSSNFVGCMTGRSTGLAPSWARAGLRILENLRNEYVAVAIITTRLVATYRPSVTMPNRIAEMAKEKARKTTSRLVICREGIRSK
jgi:hypothetical protein